MTKLSSLFNWQVLLLISPLILGLAIFCYLLWSDSRYDRKQRQKRKKDTCNNKKL